LGDDWNDFKGGPVKHFEDVWLEAEEVSVNSADCAAQDVRQHAQDIIKHLKRFESEDGDEDDAKAVAGYVGSLLFSLATLCKHLNINSWAELAKATNNAKIDLNDQGED